MLKRARLADPTQPDCSRRILVKLERWESGPPVCFILYGIGIDEVGMPEIRVRDIKQRMIKLKLAHLFNFERISVMLPGTRR